MVDTLAQTVEKMKAKVAALTEKTDDTTKNESLSKELLQAIKSLNEKLDRERERRDAQTTPRGGKPPPKETAAANGNLMKAVEEVDLVTPEGSPRDDDSPGERISLASSQPPQGLNHHESEQSAQKTRSPEAALSYPVSFQNSGRYGASTSEGESCCSVVV